MNENAVFVYGTLRKGGSNHFRMAGSDFVGEATIEGAIYMIDWNPQLTYPALVCGGEGRVRGEVYLVSEESLKALDEFEGIGVSSWRDDEYRRVEVKASLADGTERLAWLWEWNLPLGTARRLEDGDWLKYEPDPS